MLPSFYLKSEEFKKDNDYRYHGYGYQQKPLSLGEVDYFIKELFHFEGLILPNSPKSAPLLYTIDY